MEKLENKNGFKEIMDTTMERVKEMVATNSVVGEPITTPDGVTIIPISRMSFGLGCGGGDYGKTSNRFGGGSGVGAKVDPVAFLIVKDGVVRVMPVAVPALNTADRVLELVPQVMDRVENFIGKKKEKELY